ncbi:hypothetical protein SAMN05421778_111116 [Sphaerotilus natans]|nr:hypothetical protein SAMN05421778_111116 [Sphaerotilus natans]
MTDTPQPFSRPQLVVRAWQLRDADAGALKLFMNLLRSRLQAEWVVAEAGSPVDLLVLPVGAADPSGFEALATSGAIRLSIAADVAERARAEAPVLQRPLQFEEFSALMLEIEPGLIETAGARRAAPAPAPAPVTVDVAPAPAPTAAVVAAAVVVEPVPVARPSARPGLELAPGARVRLRRWPDPVQLQGRKGHQRLASQIAATALEREDLLSLSGLPEVEVDAFLQAMHRADLLEVLPPEAASAGAEAAEVAAVDPAAAEPVPGSLFGLIRRRLGIGS